MSDRAWGGASRRKTRKTLRVRCRPALEGLEERQVLNASLAPLPSITVPQYIGYQVPLDGSGSGASSQTYTVTSSNPDIGATVAQGEFATFNVSHTAANSSDISFSGQIVVQLFSDLAPTATSTIGGLISQGYYNGLQLFRVANGFNTSSEYIIQGGVKGNTASSPSPVAGFANETPQQVGFTNPGQLALANTGQPNSNGSQFFFTTGVASELTYGYTVFGQVVSGMNLVDDMSKVALQSGTTTPMNPITMNSVTLSPTNPDGVIHIDATNALVGETSTITVTATDPTTKTSTQQSFQVTIGPTSNSSYSMAMKPIGVPSTQVYSGSPLSIQLGYNQATTSPATTISNFTITTQPSDGTISNFNSSTGTLTYTPNSNFTGTDSFKFTVTNSRTPSGSTTPTTLTSQPATVTITTSAVTPTASPVTQTAPFSQPITVQLSGSGGASGQAFNYSLVSQPSDGTISNFNAQTGTLTYTPNSGASGTDSFQYKVTTVGSPTPGLNSAPATVTINLTDPAINTGAVRELDGILIVAPKPGAPGGKNTVDISETSSGTILTVVNGFADLIQPQASTITEIEFRGARASNNVTIDPSVDPTILVTMLGGRGNPRSTNVFTAGAGSTVEASWFTRSKLTGGTGENQLYGTQGRVAFRPTTATDVIFAGVPKGFAITGQSKTQFNKTTIGLRHQPPGGTFYKLGPHGHLVAIPTPTLKPDLQDANPSQTGFGTNGFGLSTTSATAVSTAAQLRQAARLPRPTKKK